MQQKIVEFLLNLSGSITDSNFIFNENHAIL